MKHLIFTALLTFSQLTWALDVGDNAPDFSLPASDGKTHTLGQYKGEKAVVIAWYPKAFTSGCTIECKSLAMNGHLIEEFEVAYFMASTDPLEDNIKFATEYEAKFPILSDESGDTAELYDVLMPVVNIAKRITVYISKEGKILLIDDDVNPETSAEDIAANLAKLNVAKK